METSQFPMAGSNPVLTAPLHAVIVRLRGFPLTHIHRHDEAYDLRDQVQRPHCAAPGHAGL